MSEPAPIRLVVLFGGQSAEHDVSRISAASMLRAIDRRRYEIEPIAIRPDGSWHRSDSTVAALAAAVPSTGDPDASHGAAGDDRAWLPDALDASGSEVSPAEAMAPVRADQPIVVLPLLHGPRGEDGTVQGLLELAGVPYVGCGVLGSALNMDKAMSKTVVAAAGVPIVRHLSVRDVEIDDAFIVRVADELGFPVFVKPANMGSSVGINRADDRAGLHEALAEAARFDEWIVVEEGVDARELEVGVLGYQEPRASVVGEIVPTHDFYDYEDKYLDGTAKMVIPADIPDEVAAEARRLALRVFSDLRCDGFARVDFFYEEDGRGLLFNEINTIPGFTPFSMFPSLWAASGLPYAELVDELVDLALRRFEHRNPHRRQR